jgi:hypothetical protein
LYPEGTILREFTFAVSPVVKVPVLAPATAFA